jgi:hypothetical protein
MIFAEHGGGKFGQRDHRILLGVQQVSLQRNLAKVDRLSIHLGLASRSMLGRH